jgi:hypothetical protein
MAPRRESRAGQTERPWAGSALRWASAIEVTQFLTEGP